MTRSVAGSTSFGNCASEHTARTTRDHVSPLFPGKRPKAERRLSKIKVTRCSRRPSSRRGSAFLPIGARDSSAREVSADLPKITGRLKKYGPKLMRRDAHRERYAQDAQADREIRAGSTRARCRHPGAQGLVRDKGSSHLGARPLKTRLRRRRHDLERLRPGPCSLRNSRWRAGTGGQLVPGQRKNPGTRSRIRDLGGAVGHRGRARRLLI